MFPNRPSRAFLPRVAGVLTPGRAVPVIGAALLALNAILVGGPDTRVAPPTEPIGRTSILAALRPASSESRGPEGLHAVRAANGAGLCAVAVTAVPGRAATLDLRIEAPCHPGARVELSQAALTVSERIDVTGALAVSLPALSDAPQLEIRVAGSEPLPLQVWVDDFETVERTVLHWQGDAGLVLHAFEGSEAPRDADASQGRGAVASLGNPRIADGHRALVHTAPVGTVVRFDVEAEASACASVRALGAFRVGAGTDAPAEALPLALTGCAPVGEVTVMGGSTVPPAGAADRS